MWCFWQLELGICTRGKIPTALSAFLQIRYLDCIKFIVFSSLQSTGKSAVALMTEPFTGICALLMVLAFLVDSLSKYRCSCKLWKMKNAWYIDGDAESPRKQVAGARPGKIFWLICSLQSTLTLLISRTVPVPKKHFRLEKTPTSQALLSI